MNKKLHKELEAYWGGADAYMHCLSIEDNPYPEDDVLSVCWDNGFKDQERQDRIGFD